MKRGEYYIFFLCLMSTLVVCAPDTSLSQLADALSSLKKTPPLVPPRKGKTVDQKENLLESIRTGTELRKTIKEDQNKKVASGDQRDNLLESIRKGKELRKTTKEDTNKIAVEEWKNNLQKIDANFLTKLGVANTQKLVSWLSTKKFEQVRNFIIDEPQFRKDLLNQELFNRLMNADAKDLHNFIQTVDDIYDKAKGATARALVKSALLQQKILFPYVENLETKQPETQDDEW